MYPICRVDYELLDETKAFAFVAAESSRQVRSLLEDDLRECESFQEISRNLLIKRIILSQLGYNSDKKGVIYNSRREGQSDCFPEGFGARHAPAVFP